MTVRSVTNKNVVDVVVRWHGNDRIICFRSLVCQLCTLFVFLYSVTCLLLAVNCLLVFARHLTG